MDAIRPSNVLPLNRHGDALAADAGETTPFEVEASLLPETHRLAPRFRRAEWDNAYLDYMQRRLRRNPRDLKSHVRRILMLHGQGRNRECFGAMLDLFLVLGEGGKALRRNLVRKVEADLTPSQRVFLNDHLDKGLTASAPLPEDAGVLLSNALSGTTNVVVQKKGEEKSVEEDPLEVARQLIAGEPPDEGTAQALLEGALRQDPGREEVCRELLALYRRNHLKDAFRCTYAALMGRRLALPRLWRETEEYLTDTKGI